MGMKVTLEVNVSDINPFPAPNQKSTIQLKLHQISMLLNSVNGLVILKEPIDSMLVMLRDLDVGVLG